MQQKSMNEKIRKAFPVYPFSGHVLLGIALLMVLTHVVAFLFYAKSHRQAVVRVNHEIVSQQVIQLIQTIKLASATDQANVVQAIDIPNVKVWLDDLPRFKPRLKTDSLWQILLVLHKQQQQMQVSLQLDNKKWLSISATVVPKRWSLQIFLLSLECIVALVILFIFWMVNRFAAPLIQFTKAAERIGRDINSPPIVLPPGPSIVQETATAMNQMQRQIQELIRDRTQMLAAMSHDLRTPITRLKLRAQFLEDSEQQHKVLADLTEMEEMISSILGFIRDDRHIEEKVLLDLNSLLSALADDFKDMGEQVDFQGCSKRLLFLGRPQALKRAFNNILGNAIKYGQRAQIALTRKENTLQVAIVDAGPGLPEEELEKVLAPFYRAEKSRSRETGGTGLGLAIADEIFRDHGGSIQLSNHPEAGLQVLVFLPLEK